MANFDSHNNMPDSAPSKKVTAATSGAAVAGLILFILGEYVFEGDNPEAVVGFVLVAVPAALAFLSGYFTKRAPRELN